MKTMKKLQVAVAAASLFVAAGSSMAASISQSGITVAREAISANVAAVQKLRAPTVSYSFDNGPTANASSTQDFNVTLVLGGDGAAEWDLTQVPTYKTVAAYRRNNGNAVVPVLPVSELGNVGANKAALVLMSVDVGTAALDTGVDATTNVKQKLRYKFRLVNNTGASISIGDLQLAFNGQNPGDGAAAPWNTGNATVAAPTAAATDYAIVTQLAKSVNLLPVTTGNDAGKTGNNDDGCGEGIRKVTVLARNYIGSGDGVQGESQGAPVQSILNGGYIQFNTALAVHVEKGVAVDRNTNPLFGNQQLTTVGAANDVNTMALGTVQFTNRNGIDAFDTGLTVPYYKFGANDLNGTPNETNGNVDVASLNLSIDATNGFATGTVIGLSNTPTCAPTAGNVLTVWGTSTATGNTLSTSFAVADLAGVFTTANGLLAVTDAGAVAAPFGIAGNATKAFICMKVPGTALIPQSRYQNAVATLFKNHSSGAIGLEQANQSCPANLAGLGGGVKVDVRNFTQFPAGGQWTDYVRIINNSETVAADVSVQYILPNGKYGKWVKLGTLAPREAKFYSNFDIKAAMLATGVVSNDVNAAPAAGQMLEDNQQGRLRVSSEAASTLRVQNYFFNATTGALSEVSASQGADFVNVEASPRDHIDQDAQAGLKK